MFGKTRASVILGVRFDLIDYRRVFEAIAQWRARGERHYVTITNPHSVMLCRRDGEMGRATRDASLTLPDGVGIVLAARVLGYEHGGRVAGPELVLRCCDWGREAGLRHYFYGGAPGVAETMIERLSAAYPGMTVAGHYSPPYRKLSCEEDAAMVEQINATQPDVVWIGLGAPKQEKWMAEHAGRVAAAAMVGVGAAFDFHSGRVKWAPAWMRRSGLEWLFRLASEPGRMWRRNLDSPAFLAGVVWQRVARTFAREVVSC